MNLLTDYLRNYQVCGTYTKEERIARAMAIRAGLGEPPAGFRWVSEFELRARLGDPVSPHDMAGAMMATITRPFPRTSGPRLLFVGGLWHLCEYDWVESAWVSLGSGFTLRQAWTNAKSKGWVKA